MNNSLSKPKQCCLVSIVFSLGLLFASQTHAQDSDMHELTTFAERYAAAWSSQDPQQFASFYAKNGVLQINDGEPSIGRDAVTETARSFMSAFPDMVVKLVELRRVDDQVQFHWRWTGTNTGPGGNGNAVDLRGYEQWILDDDGLILKSLGHYDEAEYQRQLNDSK
ncbi:MAG: nuclear transport factor 2 family protein [Xanthomonadales bacterium]|nr:nuclear transport factor 2 family protein [Xanthomonadales bacterium]